MSQSIRCKSEEFQDLFFTNGKYKFWKSKEEFQIDTQSAKKSNQKTHDNNNRVYEMSPTDLKVEFWEVLVLTPAGVFALRSKCESFPATLPNFERAKKQCRSDQKSLRSNFSIAQSLTKIFNLEIQSGNLESTIALSRRHAVFSIVSTVSALIGNQWCLLWSGVGCNSLISVNFLLKIIILIICVSSHSRFGYGPVNFLSLNVWAGNHENFDQIGCSFNDSS